MKNYSNIEKSGFHKGQYIGYAHGVWTITKSTSSYGNWFAVRRDYPNQTLFAWTLDAMSKRLSEIAI